MTQNSNQPVNLLAPVTNGSKDIPMMINTKAMGKIMSKLTDLYNNPIQATVREIVSNALDATDVLLREGKKVKPVEIHSPSQLNPYFVVRDHGVGMTPEIIEKVLAEYGASTKELDVTQTGEHGLGAKAPLSYVDEFFIETTRDGITSKVSVSRNDDGPLTRILSTMKTDEPSGTTVRVPISSYSFSTREKFEEAIENYRHYTFTMGQSISIDGVEQNINPKYHLYDVITLDEETQRKGRVWINLEVMNDYLTMIKKDSSLTDSNFYKNIDYVLSGYVYKSPYNKKWRNTDSLFLIELSPKILNFSPSRDDIIDDQKYETFEETIVRQLRQKEAFYQAVFSYYQILDKKSAYLLFSKMTFIKKESVDTTDNGEKFYLSYSKNRYETTLPDSFTASIDQFTTQDGYNPIMENEKYNSEAIFLGRVSNSKKKASLLAFYDLTRTRNENKKSYVSFEESASSVKIRLIRNFNENDEEVGLIKASSILLPNSNLTNSKETIVLVSVNSDKEISSVMRNRKYADADYLFFVKGEIKEELTNIIISRMESLQGNFSVQTENADSLKKKAAEFRRNQKQNEENNSNIVLHEYEKKISSHKDIFDYDLNNSKTVRNFTIDDLIELNPIIFIVASDRQEFDKKHVLNGLYEKDGDAVFDRPILLIGKPKKAFYEALKEYPEMFVAHPEYNAKSVLEKELLSDRRFYRSVLSDIADSIPMEVRKKAIFLSYLLRWSHYNSVLSVLNANSNSKAIVNSRIEEIKQWAYDYPKMNIVSMLDEVNQILSTPNDTEKNYDSVSIKDISAIIPEDSLLSLKMYAIIINEVVSPGSSINVFNKEVSALIMAYSKTDADYVKNTIVERIDEILGDFVKDSK